MDGGAVDSTGTSYSAAFVECRVPSEGTFVGGKLATLIVDATTPIGDIMGDRAMNEGRAEMEP